jgi:hypothetical protein
MCRVDRPSPVDSCRCSLPTRLMLRAYTLWELQASFSQTIFILTREIVLKMMKLDGRLSLSLVLFGPFSPRSTPMHLHKRSQLRV